MSDSGMHQHAGLNHELGVTSLDGPHDHEFRLPDGRTVRTESGGSHAHSIDDGFGHTVHGGVHAHRVVIDDIEYRTEVDGWHSHEIGENRVSEGGMHSHALVLADATIISLHSDTSTSKRKKGASRARKVSEKQLEDVSASALAVLSDLKKTKPYKKPKKETKKSDFFDRDDISKPRLSAVPQYDPNTRKIIR